MRNIDRLTADRWPEILGALAGLSAQVLNGRAQPCPACPILGIAVGPGENNDRFRWDDSGNTGHWYCNRCGGKDRQGGGGSGIDLLMRMKGWTFAEAAAAVEQHLGQAPATAPATSPARRTTRPARVPEAPPAGTPAPTLGRAEEQYPYGPDPANPWFWIQRIPQPPKRPGGKPGKLFVHRTWLDNQWHWPRKTDAFTSEWPTPRPIYRLPELIAAHDAPVLITEGERTANRAALLFPDHAVIAWCGGKEGKQHTDWQPGGLSLESRAHGRPGKCTRQTLRRRECGRTGSSGCGQPHRAEPGCVPDRRRPCFLPHDRPRGPAPGPTFRLAAGHGHEIGAMMERAGESARNPLE